MRYVELGTQGLGAKSLFVRKGSSSLINASMLGVRELPATQIVVTVDSDLPPGSVLTKIKIDILKANGGDEGATELPFVFIANDDQGASEDGPKSLPLSLSITRGHERTLRLRVVGWGSLSGEPVRPLVEQQVNARFTSKKTQWVHLFLGEVCIDKNCDAEQGLSCYPTALSERADVVAGECGPIEALSGAVTQSNVSPAEIDPSQLRYDAGSRLDAAVDAGASENTDADAEIDQDADPDADSQVDASADAQRPEPGADSAVMDDAGVASTKDASEAGAPAMNACSGHGCQHASLCVPGLSSYTCDCSGTGFSGARCATDVNECASNPCAASAYPCRESIAPGYTCLGQLADWPMPDASPGAKTAPSYDTTTTPGVTLDRATGLMWQRTLPSTYAGCTGMKSVAGDACTIGDVKRYCDDLSLAGFDDYRLPSKVELESIVDETRASPHIDPNAFPATPADWFWTSSSYLSNPTNTWIVAFFFGGTNPFDGTIPERVRCVRGPVDGIRAGTPSTRYRVDETANTVSDVRTGLVWQRTIVAGTFAWEAAKQQCSAGFRLPTYKELLTLVDPMRIGPSIDPAFRGESAAQATPADVFWSSSVYADGTGSAWDLSFQDGANSGNGGVAMARRVRCVK